MWQRLKKRWHRFVEGVYHHDDTARVRDQKYAFVSLALLLICGAFLWMGIAFWIARPYVFLLPLGYILTLVFFVSILFRTKKLDLPRDLVLFVSVLFPFVLQWLIGGFIASGFVMLWSILPLVGSWVFSSFWQAQRWLFLFVGMMIISGFLDSHFTDVLAVEHPHTRFLIVFNGAFLGIFNFMVAALFVRNERRVRFALRGQLEAIDRTLPTAEYLPDGEIHRANALFQEALGYSKEELLGHSHYRLMPETVSQTDETQFWKSLQSGRPQNGIFQYRHKNEKMTRWLSGTYTPVYDDEGKITKVVQIARDVTRSRLRLQDYEAQIRAFNRANAIVRLSEKGEIVQGNANFASLLGYSLIELRGQPYAELLKKRKDRVAFEANWEAVLQGAHIESQYLHRHQNEEERWIELFFYVLEGDLEKYVLMILHDITERKVAEERMRELRDTALEINRALAEKNDILEHSTKILDEKNKEIRSQHEQLHLQSQQLEKQSLKVSDSIQYASRIQQSILTRVERVKQSLEESFIMLRPRDKVSGDFYWFAEVGDRIIIIAADCTGHGVPGAFMSLIGHNLLDQMVRMMGVTSPEMMLSGLHMGVQKTLRQQETQNRDGMDIAICCIDRSQKILEFAGAKNPLLYFQNGEMFLLKGDRVPVGGFQKEKRRMFTKHTIDLSQHETTFYIFSDGFQDQFGGPRDRKFSSKRFRQLLQSIHQTPMEEQQLVMEQTLTDWKEDTEQIDDILIIGARVAL